MKDKQKDYEDAILVSIWNHRFKEAMVTKAPYTKRWNDYIDAYNGDYFKQANSPEYKSNTISNYIFSIIETIRPIMLDNNPKFLALPRQPEGMQYSNDIQQALSYEWDRERMTTKLYRELINTLTIGNALFFVPWDSDEKNTKMIPISAFNVFPDPLATCMYDAEYIIYASYKNVQIVKKNYPEKADKIQGGSVKHSELVYDNDKNSKLDNQVLVLEIYTRDYETDEQETKGITKKKMKYPNGRVLTMCPELGVLLDDKPMIYDDGNFPFVNIKDYDVPGKFWGEGEVAQLLSPQSSINELNNSIVDNAKATANMPWILDKNSGIGVGKITNRPGLVIRKNPGSEVRRDQPPSMPQYVSNTVDTFKRDLEEISGVFNSVKGTSDSGVYTAQGQLALMEAGQTRIRLKVKVMEDSLGCLGRMVNSRAKQFWKDEKWIAVTKADGSYDLKKMNKDATKYDYDIRVSAGSTMLSNRSAMLELMLRLAQTPMPDGQPLVDREAVVQYLPDEVRASIMKRMGDKHVILEELQQQVEAMQQQIGEAFQQMQEQMQGVAEESQSTDEETFKIIEELMGAVEKINEQILQIKGESDKINSEKEEEMKLEELRSKFYNEGFADAEKYASEGGFSEDVNPDEIPEELLVGIEAMSDEELQELIQTNPELIDLIK